jgi:hypothetical protein
VDTPPDLLDEIREHFSQYVRPADFIDRGHCDECAEHYQELVDATAETITYEHVENPGWDPTCFLSPGGFHYYFPGMARIADQHRDDFLEAFVMRLNGYFDALFTATERRLVRRLLESWWLDDSLSDWNRGAVEQALARYTGTPER